MKIRDSLQIICEANGDKAIPESALDEEGELDEADVRHIFRASRSLRSEVCHLLPLALVLLCREPETRGGRTPLIAATHIARLSAPEPEDVRCASSAKALRSDG